ncbi:hypothetical protein PBT90_19650 [Algoriphagus halophytocola]|uniref:Uncharacterized protein n=1 Tax=Algoriphagus halophytocola TaxID=2991499 RepID=A0ABY6MD97_9BACT|nr:MULTISPECIES: DUF6702 family protein [unclassified Algoriphagus]UZD21732.1 hypothetical protein OM944_13785 [Algoriphagus sp. TR-M5]WBL42944.1 hypothetical protein PBT90_19650 [Algoriphagus sp. TR-M9]
MQQFYISMISLGWLVFYHPFHLSLTEIAWNENTQHLEVSQKIFWDDLEIALGNFHEESIDFLNPANKEKLEDQINQYIRSKNKYWIEGREITMRYLGHEVEEDAAWFYFESEAVSKPSSIHVLNEILIDDFPDQKNIVQFFFDPQSPKSLILEKGQPEGKLTK